MISDFRSWRPFDIFKLQYLAVGFASTVVFVLGVDAIVQEEWLRGMAMFAAGMYIEVSFYVGVRTSYMVRVLFDKKEMDGD